MTADRPDIPARQPKLNTPVDALLRRRPLITILLGTVLTVTNATYRQRGEGGLPPFRYEDLRRSWHHCADGVIGGDSRVQRGICPSVMSPTLQARRLVNLAYPHAALTAAYLQRLEDALDPCSTRRLIVLGVTPTSLTPTACRLSEFAAATRAATLDRCRRPVQWFFEPYGLEAFWRLLTAQPRQGASYFSPDGWRGAVTILSAREQEVARLRDRQAAGNIEPVTRDLFDTLLLFVKRWSQAGIRVYGFRPPTDSATTDAENELYRFDQATFVSSFQSAGGVWIDLPKDAYATYDGSHVDGAVAVKLSADLARHIAAEEAARPDIRPAVRNDDPPRPPGFQTAPDQADNT